VVLRVVIYRGEQDNRGPLRVHLSDNRDHLQDNRGPDFSDPSLVKPGHLRRSLPLDLPRLEQLSVIGLSEIGNLLVRKYKS